MRKTNSQVFLSNSRNSSLVNCVFLQFHRFVMAKKITLRSVDGAVFEVDTEVAMLSEMVSNFFKEMMEGADNDQMEMPLQNVKGELLAPCSPL